MFKCSINRPKQTNKQKGHVYSVRAEIRKQSLLFQFFTELIGATLVNKLHRSQVHSSTTRHLHTVLCVPHPSPFLSITIWVFLFSLSWGKHEELSRFPPTLFLISLNDHKVPMRIAFDVTNNLQEICAYTYIESTKNDNWIDFIPAPVL